MEGLPADGRCTVSEAMRLTALGRAMFYELVAQGRLAYLKVATRRISRPEVVRLLGDHLAAGGGDNGGPASRTKASTRA